MEYENRGVSTVLSHMHDLILVLAASPGDRHSLCLEQREAQNGPPTRQGHTAWNCGSNPGYLLLSPVFSHAPDLIGPKVLCLCYLAVQLVSQSIFLGQRLT